MILLGSLVARNIKKSLLSVPVLVKRDVTVLFVTGKAVIIYLLENKCVIGFAKKRTCGLLHLPENQESIPVKTSNEDETVRTMLVTFDQYAI